MTGTYLICPLFVLAGTTLIMDHAMICKRGGFVIQRHNELRDLQAEMLRMVCRLLQGYGSKPDLQAA